MSLLRTQRARAVAAALLAVSLTALLTACIARPAAQTTLVIDKVVVHTSPDGEPPRAVCVVSDFGVTSAWSEGMLDGTGPKLRWSNDDYGYGWLTDVDLRLRPVRVGDRVNVYMGVGQSGCRVSGNRNGSSQIGGDSFLAGTGFSRLKRNGFDYTVHYHIE